MRPRVTMVVWVAAVCVAASIGMLSACGQRAREIREWRADDHAQPVENQPSRQAEPAEAEAAPDVDPTPASPSAVVPTSAPPSAPMP